MVLIYSPRYHIDIGTLVAEALRRELKAFLEDVGRGGASRFEREATEVLRGIERGARHETPGFGTGAYDYLALVARILHERPPDTTPAPTILFP